MQPDIEITVAPVVVQVTPQAPIEVTVTPIGARGAQGGQGDPGADADKTYHHVQSSPSATWVIVHNLNKHPSVTVIDSAGSYWSVAPVYDSPNQVTLPFIGAFSGDAYLN